MEIKINEVLQAQLKEQAEKEGISVEELVNHILAFSIDTALCTITAKRVEDLLINEILPRIMNLQVNVLANRHQVLNLHADIAEDQTRPSAIAKEATEIASATVFDEFEEIEEVLNE